MDADMIELVTTELKSYTWIIDMFTSLRSECPPIWRECSAGSLVSQQISRSATGIHSTKAQKTTQAP